MLRRRWQCPAPKCSSVRGHDASTETRRAAALRSLRPRLANSLARAYSFAGWRLAWTEGPLRAVVAALMWLTMAATASAQNAQSQALSLLDRVTPQVLERIYPGATRVAALTDSGPIAAAAYADATLVGYVFS